jgi:Cu+-exporting ATPase
VVLGNTALMTREGIDVAAHAKDAEALRSEGAAVIYLARDDTLAVLLAVADPIKDSTAEALQALRNAGLRLVMATGDGVTRAKAVGQRLGHDKVHGEVKPADKRALAEDLQRKGGIIAMAGDGNNDARRWPPPMSALRWERAPTWR